MRKNRIIYALILIVLFWIMIMYNSWQTELIFKSGVLIPVFAGIINFFTGRQIKIYFDEQEEYCQKDDSIRKYIMIDNGTMFPVARIELQVEIQDYLGNKEKRTIVVNSEPHTIRNFGMEMTFHHYGIMSIRIRRIRVYDFFFLSVFRKKMNVETMIYIFPDLDGELEFHLKSNQYNTEDNENEEFSNGQRGHNRREVVEVDEYREGDDIRNIHWKLSSKSEDLIIKHYSNQVDEKVHLHVDVLVDAAHKYASCDRILGVLNSVVRSCVANKIDFDITGYGENGSVQTDLNNILKLIEVRRDRETVFANILQNKKKAGTHIYITTGEVRREIIPEDTVYISLKDSEKEKEDRKQYYLEDSTVIHLDVEDRTLQNKKENCFIEPYNDKIRQHKKMRYGEGDFRYVAYMSLIALLAACLAVFSVYDVMFYQTINMIIPIITVSIFVFLHFVMNVVGEDTKNKRFGKIHNIIIFCGYFLVVLLGGVSFIFDGVSEVIEAFGMDIIVGEDDYGFFEYTSDSLEWLLILVTYAVADVIYNFSMEFVLPVHILIVVPLISISMIVGYVPPMYVVLLGLIYFPAIFAINSCIRFGKKKSKKYLSDDYPYTGNVAVSSGITTIIITMVVFVLTMVNVFWGGYSRPVWMKQCKSVVNSVLEADSLDGSIKILSDLFKSQTVRTASERGKLDDTEKVSYTGDTVLNVNFENADGLNKSFYLKSFAGTNYTGDSWKIRSNKELAEEEDYLRDVFDEFGYVEKDTIFLDNYFTDTAAFREKISYVFASQHFLGNYLVSTEDGRLCNMEITSLLKEDTNIYQPYYSCPTTIAGEIYGSDGYEYTSKSEDEVMTGFTVYYIGNTLNTNNVRKKYGSYPYVWEGGIQDEDMQMIMNLEERYADYVEENYIQVPEELESLKERFSDVMTVYQGKKVNLVSGDYQYRTLGYEPYVQYVRQYFGDNGFTYNVNITRKNDEGDFIEDFMKRKTGYCIHFASAAVMMFRSMGIPARYAEGYFVDRKDIVEDEGDRIEYEVTDKSAHAWVEIYQERLGWVPVEVTPGAENFIVNREELVTGNSPQQTTAQPQMRETSSMMSESTSAGDRKQETTTQQQTTADTEENKSAVINPQCRAVFKSVLILLAVVTAFLLRYQMVSSHNVRRLENKSKKTRFREMDRQLREMFQMLGIKPEESDINEVKAEIICNSLKNREISQEEALEALAICDKFRYAPRGSVSREELDKLYAFVQKYGELMYEERKIHEKFIYKYIKCLYLKNK